MANYITQKRYLTPGNFRSPLSLSLSRLRDVALRREGAKGSFSHQLELSDDLLQIA